MCLTFSLRDLLQVHIREKQHYAPAQTFKQTNKPHALCFHCGYMKGNKCLNCSLLMIFFKERRCTGGPSLG